MNQKSLIGIIGILLILSMFINFYSMIKIQDLEKYISSNTQETKKQENHEEHEDFELAEKMMYLQRYSEKLFFSGSQKNWELAKFYLEEMEETAEKVVKANKIEEGINISVQMKEMLLPKIQELEEKVKQKNLQEFDKSYKAMLMNCNGCHMISKHEFIKIREPKQNVYSQEF